MSLIKLNNICVEYGRGKQTEGALMMSAWKLMIRNLSRVMGKSGCGKTTLLNVLGTPLKPQSGEYIFDGKPVLAKTAMNLQNSETKIWAL